MAKSKLLFSLCCYIDYFIEALSVIENIEVIQEISQDAVNKACKLQMKAVQSDYLNDSSDFVEALYDHISKQLLTKNNKEPRTS